MHNTYNQVEQSINIRMDKYRLKVETEIDLMQLNNAEEKIIKDSLFNSRIHYYYQTPKNYVTTQQTITQQTNYGLYNSTSRYNSFNSGLFGGFGSNANTNSQNVLNENNLQNKTHTSLFRLILERNMEPLIHLLLANNLSYGMAVMDGIRAFKFSLVNKILERVHADEQLVYSNQEGQNLWHTVAMFSSTCPPLELLNIIKTFINNKKIDACKADSLGRNQLHLAAAFNNVN